VLRLAAFEQLLLKKANGNKMLTALILICSLSSVADSAACTEQNALQVLRSPATFASPVACLMHGQAYVANSAIGRDLNEGETVKVICKRNHVAAAPPAAVGEISTVQEVLTQK
jgi:poly(3-hydroxybutyrate) depolymerase